MELFNLWSYECHSTMPFSFSIVLFVQFYFIFITNQRKKIISKCQNEQICLYEGFRFIHKYAKLFYILMLSVGANFA